MDFVGAATPLTEGDINAEAHKLGVEPAAIWAVCEVESAGSGFLTDGRPKILFEAHYFHTLTGGRFDRSYPNISSPVWDRSLYGHSGAHQYDRLEIAISLNRTAGLESASWGRFQIMGANYEAAGHPDIESFVQAMMASEANHLLAFGAFCQHNGIVRYLISHDWAHFALRYNGSGQVSYYAQKLADAYQRHLGANTGGSASPSPGGSPQTALRFADRGVAVTLLQNNLLKLGYQVATDGIFGAGTMAAVQQFQLDTGLNTDGIAGPKTLAAVDTAVAAIP